MTLNDQLAKEVGGVFTIKSRNTWTEERIAELRKLVDERVSASKIAEALGNGLTRNAVIGKMHRLGIESKAMMVNSGAKPKIERSEIVVKRIRAARTKAVREADWTPKPRETLPVREAFTCNILDLTLNTCRWPDGGEVDRPPFRYCGATTIAEGKAYCATHWRKAHQRVVRQPIRVSGWAA